MASALLKALDDCRRQFCEEALRNAGGNISVAARQSGVTRQHFHKLMQRYKIASDRRQGRRGNWGNLHDEARA